VSILGWILLGGLLMSALTLVGAITLLLPEAQLRRVTLPLVAFSAGSLLGGALFHMLPASLTGARPLHMLAWVAVGFAMFLALEQFLHWHHCHGTEAPCRQPVGVLILVGDGLHNFLGGLAVAGAFLVDLRVGLITWLAAAAHEVPQELGDFAVLLHSGWNPTRALAFNLLSGLTFPLAGVLAYFVSFEADVSFLLPLAAGNFIYIAASDLVPQVNRHRRLQAAATHFACFLAGLLLLGGLAALD